MAFKLGLEEFPWMGRDWEGVCVWWGQGRKFSEAMEEPRTLRVCIQKEKEVCTVGM